MSRHRMWLVGGLVFALIASVAVVGLAEQDEGSEKKRSDREAPKRVEKRRKDTRGQEGGQRAEQRRKKQDGPEGARQRVEGMAGKGFIWAYLQDNTHFKAEVKKHKETMQKLHKRARAIREQIKEKLSGPGLTPEEKEAIIEEAKERASKVLTRIVNEMLRHRKVVDRIIKAEKENIVEEAVEHIFSRRRRGGRPGIHAPGEEGERGGGGRRPGKRRPRRNLPEAPPAQP